ncbi:MAG: SpoIIE family protein phosphatase [Acidimicrobiales bacterium]
MPLDAEQARLVAPTIQALSERHGGHTVALLAIDRTAGTATPIAVHDPDPEARHELSHLVGASIPLAGTICGLACDRGAPIEFGDALPGGPPDEMLPEGWVRFASRHGIRSGVVVPARNGGEVVGLLVTARRDRQPLSVATIDALGRSGDRLGRLLPSAEPTSQPPNKGAATGRSRPRVGGAALDVALGLVAPAVLAGIGATWGDPNSVRPVSILLLICAALGLLRSRRSSEVCAVAGLVVVWIWFTPPTGSLRIADGSALASLIIAALTLTGVQVLLHQVAISRRQREEEAAVIDALIARLPLGFGMLDLDRRFRRLNDRLADFDGAPVAEHLGQRPGDVNPLVGELYEPLLDRVVDTGEAVEDEVVSFDLPDTGLTHSWRINQYPVQVDGRTIGVGTTVQDVTDEMVVRRRAQLMLRLARIVAGASDLEQVAAIVSTVLSEGLKARCAFAISEGGWISVHGVDGYRDRASTQRWLDFSTRLDEAGPLVTCLDASELVIASIDLDGDGPELALHRDVENVTIAWQPVTRPGDQRPSAAIGVAWPYRRRLTDHSRTLLQTAASVTGLAMARIALTRQAERDRFRTAMDAMIDQVILVHSIRDVDGRIVDFEVDFANATMRSTIGLERGELLGSRLSVLYPRSHETGMFERFRNVVETGQPWVADRLPYADVGPNGRAIEGYWNLQVVKVDDGCIAASRDVTAVVEAEHLAEQAREVAQRERIAVDLLQRAALPAHLPQLDAVELTAHYRPARPDQPVGGDWYDAFELDGGTLALIIADVAGDGPEAAGTMVQVRNIFRAIAAEGLDPGIVLARVDEVVRRFAGPSAPFITCCYALLDPATGGLRWASAGHLPPLISRHGGGVEVGEHAPGPPLASLLGRSYPVAETKLAPGDMVVMYTDGLVERRGEVIDTGLERLREQVAGHANACRAVAEGLAEGLGDASDDTAILCARYCG